VDIADGTTDTYTISALVDSAAPITGIFLDAIKDPALPGGGPGGQYGNGNFVVSEFTLDAGAGGSTVPFTVDTVTPTVAVSIDNTDVNVANPTALVTFTFSKAPTDFSLNDVTSVDGSLSNLSGSGTTYTATFTANAEVEDSAATVSVINGSYHDADGNAGTGASTMLSVEFSSAVATFYEVQNNWAPSQMIDGIFTGPPPSPGQDATYGGVNGWSVFDFATGMADGADALLTIASPLAAGQHTLTFKLYSNYYGNPGHLLGDFRTCRRSAELGRHFRGVGAFPRATDYEPQSLSS
jgi:Bacterial Ig-like domain